MMLGRNCPIFTFTNFVRSDVGAAVRQSMASADTATNDRPGSKSRQFDLIRNAIKAIFPRAKVFVYGSHNYGLADERSDLNAYIDLGEKNAFLMIGDNFFQFSQ